MTKLSSKMPKKFFSVSVTREKNKVVLCIVKTRKDALSKLLAAMTIMQEISSIRYFSDVSYTIEVFGGKFCGNQIYLPSWADNKEVFYLSDFNNLSTEYLNMTSHCYTLTKEKRHQMLLMMALTRYSFISEGK